jgi:hypothetical protein
MKDVIKKEILVEDFIGIYDGYIPELECDNAIKIFKKEEFLKKSYDRIRLENCSPNVKNDSAINIEQYDGWFSEFKPLLLNLDMALKDYCRRTGILEAYGIKDLGYTTIKIQKTLPTQGYHVWHVEHGGSFESAWRALVFTVYLNDIEEGGETEFLHQSKRVKPKKGRIVFFPSGFPYVHRGNPPLKGEKYIMTSWLMLPKE